MPSANFEFRESRFVDGFVCPRRGSKTVIRHGRERSGLQRYFCKGCQRTFNDRTATPKARTKRPDKWAGFTECMREGYTC